MKQCPVCKTPAPLDATVCASCKHAYRTQFSPTAETTRALPALSPDVALHRQNRRKWIAWGVGILLMIGVVRFLMFCSERAVLVRRGTVASVISRTNFRNANQVREMLGPPDRVFFDGGYPPHETWLYRCKDGVVSLRLTGEFVQSASGQSD